MIQTRKLSLVVLVCVLAMALGIAWARPAQATQAMDATDASDLEIKTLDETQGKKFGVLSGGAFDQLVMKSSKGVSQDDFLYFNSNAEVIGALMTGKVDVFATDQPIAELAVNKNEGIGIIPELYMEDHYGFVLPKNSDLTSKINERLEAYRANGTLDAIKNKWMAADDSGKAMPELDGEAANGTLTVATTLDNEPVNYLIGDRPSGLCLELLELILHDLAME